MFSGIVTDDKSTNDLFLRTEREKNSPGGEKLLESILTDEIIFL